MPKGITFVVPCSALILSARSSATSLVLDRVERRQIAHAVEDQEDRVAADRQLISQACEVGLRETRATPQR